MSSQIELLLCGCALYGLKIEKGYVVKLDGEILLPTVARIVGIGAPNGMLVFNNQAIYWPLRKQLQEAGYGVYSWAYGNRQGDAEDFYEMICDWGFKD
jgi:hypothetical protein